MSAHPFLAFAIIIFGLAWILSLVYAWSKKADVFDPIVLFLAFFGLFTLPLPVNLLFTNLIEDDFGRFSAQEYVPIAVLLCAISLPFLVWAYYSPLCSWVARRLPVPGHPKVNRYFQPFFSFDRTRFAALLICGIALFMVWQLAAGNLVRFLLLGYNSTAEMVGKGHLSMGMPWFFVGSLFLLHRYATLRGRYNQYVAACAARQEKPKRAGIRGDLFLFVGLFALQLLATFMLARRHTILQMVLTVTLLWHFAVRRLSFFGIATLTITGFLVLNLYGILRSSNYENVEAFVHSLGEARSSVQEKGTLTYTLTQGEFVGPFQTMPQIMRKFGSSEVPCQWGLTYLQAPVGFIPQVIYPNRPLALTNWYMDVYYGHGYHQNQGEAFYFLTEGYLNFGPIGVVLTMLVWGALLGVLDHYRKLHPENSGVALIYAVSLAYIVSECVAGDSRTLIASLPVNVLGVAMVGLMVAGGFSSTRESRMLQ